MLLIKDVLILFIIIFSFYQVAQLKSIQRSQDADYDGSPDYFEVNTVTKAPETSTTTQSYKNLEVQTQSKSSETSEDENDDGVTCSISNVTDILSKFEVEHTVLVIFKVNITENERELIYFLNLAKRFSDAPSVFADHRFIVLTIDNSSDLVYDFIYEKDYPHDIVVIDEDEYPDLGFVIDLDDMHVYVVDQCGKLAYIIVPPWSSAQHPYVKAAVISTIIDLPCECPASEFSSNKIDSIYLLNEALADNLKEVTDTTTTSYTSTTDDIKTSTNDEFGAEDVENIEALLDNQNRVDESLERSENFSVPLRIIIPSVHVHYDESSHNYYKYDEIIYKSDDESYHNHYDSGDKLFDISDERLQSFNDKIFVGNNSFNDIKEQFSDSKILVNKFGSFYKILKKLNDNVYDVGRVEIDVIKMPPTIQIFGVQHHYKQLNKWILYKI
ncbi:hypothetical protein ACKWTF_010817 [Chironomus riparius]